MLMNRETSAVLQYLTAHHAAQVQQWSLSADSVYALSVRIQDHVEAQLPQIDGLWLSLLSLAVGRVNWYVVAQQYYRPAQLMRDWRSLHQVITQFMKTATVWKTLLMSTSNRLECCQTFRTV